MPIRFRCVYCEQLLGIARRKAGTVVKCPNCGGQLIVPPPEEVPAGEKTLESADVDEPAEPKIQAPKGGSAGKHQEAPVATQSQTGTEGAFLFERSDFDELLRPAGEKKSSLAGAAAGKKAGPQTIPPPLDLAELEPLYNVPTAPQAPGAPAPLIQSAAKAPPKHSGILLTPMRLTIAVVFLILALIGAFGGGLYIGAKFLAKKFGG